MSSLLPAVQESDGIPKSWAYSSVRRLVFTSVLLLCPLWAGFGGCGSHISLQLCASELAVGKTVTATIGFSTDVSESSVLREVSIVPEGSAVLDDFELGQRMLNHLLSITPTATGAAQIQVRMENIEELGRFDVRFVEQQGTIARLDCEED